MRSSTQRHCTKAGALQGAWKEIKVSEEPKAGEIVFKFKDKVLYGDGGSAFPAQVGLATYLVTSSPGSTTRNRLAKAPP